MVQENFYIDRPDDEKARAEGRKKGRSSEITGAKCVREETGEEES